MRLLLQFVAVCVTIAVGRSVSRAEAALAEAKKLATFMPVDAARASDKVFALQRGNDG